MSVSLYVIGNILLLAAIPPANLFCVFYAWRSPWRELMAGRSLMYVFVALSATLDQIALSVWIGSEYPGRYVIRILLYTAIAVTFWRMFWTLLHIQSRPDSSDGLSVSLRRKASPDAEGGNG